LFSKIIKINKIYSLLVYFIPYSLIAGHFFADLNITLLGLIFILKLIVNKDSLILKNKFSLIFGFFYMTLLISSLLSNNIFLSLESSLFYFRFFFYSMAIYYGLKHNIFIPKYLLYNFLFVISVLLFDGYYQYFSGFNLLNYKWDGDRLSGLFGKEKILGSFLSRVLPFTLAIIFAMHKNKLLVYYSLIILVASDVLIVISGDRAAAFYLLFSTLIIIILIQRFKYLRLFSFMLSLILVYLIIMFSDQVKDRIINKTLNEIVVKDNPIQEPQTPDSQTKDNRVNNSYNLFNKIYFFTQTHTNYAKVSLKMFFENPYIGVGPKLYRFECKNSKYFIEDKQYCNTHPHNTYLQLLAETGIIGFSFIFIFLLWIIKNLFYQLYSILILKKYYFSDYLICIFVSILISLFPIIPSGSFFNQWLNVIYYLPIGFLLYEFDNNKSFLK